jgi:hypothetical protein
MMLPDPNYDRASGADLNTPLSEIELRAMACTAELANLLGKVVGNDRTRAHDLAELVHHVHAIQHAVMAQAAARVYPAMFRRLGEVLK